MIGNGIGRIAMFVVIESEAKNSWRGTFVRTRPVGKRNYLNVLNFLVQRSKNGSPILAVCNRSSACLDFLGTN